MRKIKYSQRFGLTEFSGEFTLESDHFLAFLRTKAKTPVHWQASAWRRWVIRIRSQFQPLWFQDIEASAKDASFLLGELEKVGFDEAGTIDFDHVFPYPSPFDDVDTFTKGRRGLPIREAMRLLIIDYLTKRGNIYTVYCPRCAREISNKNVKLKHVYDPGGPTGRAGIDGRELFCDKGHLLYTITDWIS